MLIAVLTMVLLVGVVSAAVIQYFGQIQMTANVRQAILLDGRDYTTMPITETVDVAGGESFWRLHYLQSQTSVPVTMRLETTYSPLLTDAEITTTYNTEITDDKSQFTTPPETLFGSQNNELVAIGVSLTLNAIFAGDGLKYTYTVLAGGANSGASPIIAVLDLSDGRHIALFPGWGARTGTHTLQFSNTVAADTGGNNLVELVLYPADFSVWLYGSMHCGYGDFEAVNADTTLLDGTEVVTRIAIQHQAAGTMETDRLESLAIGSYVYQFIQITEGASFTLQPGQTVYFVARYKFALDIYPWTYTITTTIEPAS